MGTTRQYHREDTLDGGESNGYLRSPSHIHHDTLNTQNSNILVKSSSYTCSSCGNHKLTSTFTHDGVPSLHIHESALLPGNHHSPSSSRPPFSPSTHEPENGYRAFLREATKAHKRRSLDMRSMMLSSEEAEPHRAPRKLLLARGIAHDHDVVHSHQCHSPERRRANSVQSDSGVDKLKDSLRRKKTMPASPPRRKLLDRGNTCTCQTPQALVPPGPSPGPGAYDLDDIFTRSTRNFTISPAPSPRLSHTMSNLPGPGSYSPIIRNDSPAFSMGSSSNITPTKQPLFIAKSETPGPGAYVAQSPMSSPRVTKSPISPPSARSSSSHTSPRVLTRRTSLTDVRTKTRNSPSPTMRENGKHHPKALFSSPASPKKLLSEKDELF